MAALPTPSTSMIESVFNHVVLPPRLPGRQEADLDNVTLALTQYLVDASRRMGILLNGQFGSEWDSVRRLLECSRLLNLRGRLDRNSLLTAFRELEVNGLLILHIAEQNAGMLIRPHKK
jgi:hypothetical protein